MIVATGATQRQPQERGAGRADPVDHGLDTKLLLVGAAFLIDHRVAKEPSGDELVRRGRRQHVAGHLFDCELVERQVAIQGVDDPVAIFPDRAGTVDRVAVGVGVVGQVEPIAPPAFAVVRRGQQPIDQPLVSIAAGVGQKRVHFFRAGRQPQQVEAQSPDERGPGGLGRRLQVGRFQPGEHKSIDRVAHPGPVLHGRRIDRGQRLERPMIARAPRRQRRAVRRRPGSLVDPTDKRGDFLRVQPRLLGRHCRHFFVIATDGLDQQALGTLARHDRRAAVAPLHPRVAPVEPQARLLSVGAVALEAAGFENRCDVTDEIYRFIGPRRASAERRQQDGQEAQDSQVGWHVASESAVGVVRQLPGGTDRAPAPPLGDRRRPQS